MGETNFLPSLEVDWKLSHTEIGEIMKNKSELDKYIEITLSENFFENFFSKKDFLKRIEISEISFSDGFSYCISILAEYLSPECRDLIDRLRLIFQ